MRHRHIRILVVAAAAAFSAACASTGAVPRPFPAPTAAAPAPVTAGAAANASGLGAAGASDAPLRTTAIVQAALKLRGAPYRDGGDTPNGFDCSGFTQYVFAEEGIALPRSVREQFGVGTPIAPPDELEPGDLLFFTTTDPGASHVAIWLGGGEFVHAPSAKGVVRVESLATGYWLKRYLGARRITQP